MKREKEMLRFRAVTIIGCLLLACGSLWGQATATASLQGTIDDKTGAMIASATVTIINQETGATRTIKTNGAGEYRFDLMPAGVYNIKIAANGFSAAEAKNVELLIGRTTTQNFGLKPGAITETVEVTATAPLVDQEKTDVSMNMTPEQVQELPINGRDFGNLAALAPGAKPADSYDPTKNRYSVFAINGSSGRNINMTVNGVDNKDNTVGGPVMQLPLEAVQEFAISTERFSAANGRSEGAAINVITKSGTNAYHGSVYGFFRDQALNAANFDEKQNGGQKSPYSRQQFGGSVGGPVKKDKAFLFFAYERLREHTSLTVTQKAFQELTLVKTLGAQPANVIPTPFFETRYNGRADYKFNDRHSAYLSYSSQGNNSLNDQSTSTNDLTNGNFTTNQLQIANLTLNSILSSNIVNQATVGWQYWNNLISTNSFTPTFTFPGSITFGTNGNVPQQSFQRKWQFKDDISINHGRHTFKTGFDYLWEPSLGGFFEFNPTLALTFLDDPSVILSNAVKYPNGFGTPGAVVAMSATSGNPDFIIATKMFGLYFQDTWKVSNRLTLDLGMRWDKDFNLIGGTAVQNSRTFQELKAINSPLAASVPHDDNKDFSPRIGFAYDLTGGGKHLIRGGYGLYYGQVFENIPLFMIQQQNATIFQTTFSISSSGPGDPTADLVPGAGKLLSAWRFGVDPLPVLPPASSSLAKGATGRMMDPNYRNPYSQTWNFGYSWQLTPHSAFEAEYVHELGLHESKAVNMNPKNPAAGGARPLSAAFAAAGVPVLGPLDDESAIGRSRYDGMNITYRQQMWKHVSLNATYTLSRAVAYDGSAASFGNAPTSPSNPFKASDFGPVPNDELHHVTITGVTDLPYGIRIAPVMVFGSARPYNPILGYDALGVGSRRGSEHIVVNNNDPNNLLAYQSPASASAVRACLAAGTCHELSYDSLRGSPFFQLDTRVSKIFKLGEKPRLEIMANFFNLTNRANFGNNYDGNLQDLTSGGTYGNHIGFINPGSTIIARSLYTEFGARFSF